MLFQTDDLRIENIRPLLPPAILMEEVPAHKQACETVAEARRQIGRASNSQACV